MNIKKRFAILAIVGLFAMGTTYTFAQDQAAEEATEQTENMEGAAADSMSGDSTAAAEMQEEATIEEAPAAPEPAEEESEAERSFHQVVKDKFIEGGASFMAFVLICLILGLAVCIERILYLNMATTNTEKLLSDIEDALNNGGVEKAKEVARNTRGPVASIFYQGLTRVDHGIDMVEKSIVSYGSVQMGLLEKGLSWIALFIALAPMLGFFGTVIGMIGAFDAIAAANNISPGIVAEGIGQALITTVSGLLVAMVLQVFYNYIVSKVDSIVNDMEDASITMVDILIRHQVTNK